MHKKRDYGLILSLGIIIAAGSYWFVKELPSTDMEHYLDLLGNRLVELVPKQSEKDRLSTKYNALKTRVKENEVQPENLEKMAAAIINLSNSQDTLSLGEAESLLALASPGPENVDVPAPPDAKVAALPEKWKNFNSQIDAINELDQKLQEAPVISGAPPIKKYRVDSKLNIIIDSSERQKLQNDALIHKLEEEKRLVWVKDMMENLKEDLNKLESEIAKKQVQAHQNSEQLKIEIQMQPFFEKSLKLVDSLSIVYKINWDSLANQIEKEIREENHRDSHPKASVDKK